MDISQFTIEDFIYDPEFRKWVLYPDFDSINLWEGRLLENPSQRRSIMQAREILLRMVSGKDELSETELDEIWVNIDAGVRESLGSKRENKIIPINSFVKVQNQKESKPIYWGVGQFYRIAAILVISFGLGMLAATFFSSTLLPVESDPIVYEEHHTLQGVKSNLTLSDGSNVILNSGSSIRYVKGFDKDKREIFLDGEAYFDVFKDLDRPFIVRKANISITALGTSFNVKAYNNEVLDISLISGQVGIDLVNGHQKHVLLEKGESLRVKPKDGTWIKALFNEEEVIGWTKKMIIFNKTPVSEAIRVLENWYGITFQLENEPSPGLLLSGRFENETLENVLEGLSYTIKLDFEVKDSVVNIRF
jgi:ferric-dicitrate binding protein FerR (iron transport regulator)